MTKSLKQSQNKGYLVITALVFSGIFLVILYGLVGFVFTQHKVQRQARQSAEALQAAEAGLDWYRWYLAHNPEDFDGPDDSMPYVKDVTDPERGLVGKAEINILSNQFCGEIQSVNVESVGWDIEDANVTRTVRARYTRPSVAEYSYILNSNVWAGPNREINGPYHSNGGIRMDGENNSLVTSAKEEWECTDGFGCGEDGETRSGVFGDGPNDNLWDFPVPQIDFAGITLEMNEIEDLAKQYGIDLGAAGGQSDEHGWHLIFNGNGTVDVYRVQKIDEVEAYDSKQGRHSNYSIINMEKFRDTYTIPEDCPVIFAGDRTWIEGDISQKVTVAAQSKNPNYDVNIILNDDISYTTNDGSAGLTVVAENSVYIPLVVPDNMELNGVFIAQKGSFGRDHYSEERTSGSLEEYIKRDQLTITGSIISNGRVGTRWTSDGTYVSGFNNRFNSYDRNQAVNPPPLTPPVSEEYEFARWQEVRN